LLSIIEEPFGKFWFISALLFCFMNLFSLFCWETPLQVIEGQAGVHRCKAYVDFKEEQYTPYPAVVNDNNLHLHVVRVGQLLLGSDNVHDAKKVMAGEDFAFFQQLIPGAMFSIGIRNDKVGAIHSPHSPFFFLDEEVLPIGAALHTALAELYLKQHNHTLRWNSFSIADKCIGYFAYLRNMNIFHKTVRLLLLLCDATWLLIRKVILREVEFCSVIYLCDQIRTCNNLVLTLNSNYIVYATSSLGLFLKPSVKRVHLLWILVSVK